jgi:hypothetical protein
MAAISSKGAAPFSQVVQSIDAKVDQVKSFEAAAQLLTDAIYQAYSESVVLTRVFATVPFQSLPADVSSWVKGLAQKKGIESQLTPSTLVLSLMGSTGSQANWKGRKASQGHVGIPLVSASFISQIPMMSRMLSAMGQELGWIDPKESAAMTQTIGKLSGLFYVEDAEQNVDHLGRKIIADQAFVAAHKVHTVIGIGGSSAFGSGTFFVLLIFTREYLPMDVGLDMQSAMTHFKTVARPFITNGNFFSI